MDFIDDEAGNSHSSEVLVQSSQDLPASELQPRRKRRRVCRQPNPSSGDDSSPTSDSYDLPSEETQEPIEVDDTFENPKSKYDAFMHIPAFAETQSNEFVSQIDQQIYSSPTAIRGPRWQKHGKVSHTEPISPIAAHEIGSVTSSKTGNLPMDEGFDDFDDNDASLIEALVEAGNVDLPDTISILSKPVTQAPKIMRQTTLFGMGTTQSNISAPTQVRKHNWPMASRNESPTHHKIDRNAMQTWIYPLNVGSIRDYQFNIIHRALFHNVLVALPTGLGKTFIAATLMLNYFNWTTDAQIIFVAPTKPLVTQQVDACFHIAGIPRSQTTLLTGEVQPAVRAEEWQEKRVFFMTPQTLINDLKTGMADPKKIVLLVVDEAHRATGNYAYVEVVRFLRRFNSSFRVLALTATPGATVEAVQKVIDGLDIARVEIRTDESMDIRQFVHKKNEDIRLLDNSEEIEMCLDLFADAVRPVLAKVNSLNAYYSTDPKTMTVYGLLKGREQWAKSDAGRKANWGLKSMVNSCFKPLMSLAHSLELLKFHGIGPFYHKMKDFDETGGSGKYVKQITDSEGYKDLMKRLKAWVNDDSFVGHPKLTYLNEAVLNHFMDAGSGIGAAAARPPSDTRIMVFAHYRDSAEEIVRVLNRHQPMVRAHAFVGQAGTKGSEGMDQKTQIDIIKKFKEGIYNTIVATSIGEEGLDIGEVDLIICYDSSKSPIRMLQRMGRTGRKRAGNIVLLLMRGKEERDYHTAKDNYLKMQAIIESGREFSFHDDASPRIVPRDIQPAVDKCHVDIPFENTQAGSLLPQKKKSKNTKRPPKKFHMPDNVETGFRFLGGQKSKTKGKKAPLSAKLRMDERWASLPSLQNVLINQRDEEELEDRYAQIEGDEAQYVQAVRFDAFPEVLHQSGRTSLVQHSATTLAFVSAFRIMRMSDHSWQRPDRSSIIGNFSQVVAMSDCGRDVVPLDHRPQIKANNRHRMIKRPSVNEPDDDDYDLNDEFIDDRPVGHVLSSSQPDIDGENECSQGVENRHGNGLLEKPFYVSQQSVQDNASEAGELPDINQFFGKSTSETWAISNGTNQSLRQRAKRRRVLSDDSDE